MLSTTIIGKKYENLAQNYLKKKKYKILATNFSAPCGEIDIIATPPKSDIVVFVEVKYRTSNFFGAPIEAVTEQKIVHIHNTAMVYLKKKRWLEKHIRFDVIEVLDEQIRHVENAF